MSGRKTTLVVVAGFVAVVAALPLAGLSRLGVLASIYDHGGKWILGIAAIAIGVVLGLQLDRMIELKKKRARPSSAVGILPGEK
jgi:uncharacterized membrane protein AbrB (regulator of aidB expression)